MERFVLGNILKDRSSYFILVEALILKTKRTQNTVLGNWSNTSHFRNKLNFWEQKIVISMHGKSTKMNFLAVMKWKITSTDMRKKPKIIIVINKLTIYLQELI